MAMSDDKEKAHKAGREDRLKAALRANLRRRKTQAKDREALDAAPDARTDDQPGDG